MASEVKVPTLGESVTEGTIAEWLKQPGDPVKVDEPIVSLETDKVAIEVPSPVGGTMGEHKAAVGDNVEVGAVIAIINDEVAAGESTSVEPREKPGQEEAIEEEIEDLPAETGSDEIHMSPAPP